MENTLIDSIYSYGVFLSFVGVFFYSFKKPDNEIILSIYDEFPFIYFMLATIVSCMIALFWFILPFYGIFLYFRKVN